MPAEVPRRNVARRLRRWWMHVGIASAGLAGVPFPLEPLLADDLAREPGPDLGRELGRVDWDAELLRLLEAEGDDVSGW